MLEKIELSAERRRVALAALPRDRLGPIAERCGPELADRRGAANHGDAIVGAPRVGFPEARILGLGNGSGAQGDGKASAAKRIDGRQSNASVAALDVDASVKLTRGHRRDQFCAVADTLHEFIASSDDKIFQRISGDVQP